MGFFGTMGYYISIPFAALLRLFYSLTGSYGAAIILFTLVIKLVLLPFQMKSKKSMVRMSRMSGRVQEIQKKYANNQAKMNEEIQRLYAEEGVNPMGGCLWSFLPLPILLSLYSIMRQPITHFMMLGNDVVEKMISAVSALGTDMSQILQMKDGVAVVKDGLHVLGPYGQINLVREVAANLPELGNSIEGWINVNYGFLGLDLSLTPWSVIKPFHINGLFIGMLMIPLLTGISQFLMTKVTMKQQGQDNNPAMNSTKGMMYMMPLMTVYFGFVMPAALGVYWIAQSVFSLFQEIILGKFYNEKLQKEEDEREAARAADRKKRMEEGRVQQEKFRNQTEQKLTLKEKQKAAQDAKLTKKKITTSEAGRVGERPYARGRSYQADRYDEK